MTKQKLSNDQDRSTAFAISADGYTVATGYQSGKIQIWDLKTEKELRTFSAHREAISSLLFSRDNKVLFSGSTDKRLKLWDPFKGIKLKSFRAHRGKINSLALNDSGTLLVSCSTDRKIRIWDITNDMKKKYEMKEHKDVVSKALFIPSSDKIISSSWDNTIFVWDYSTGSIVSELKGHFNSVYDIALTNDAKILFSCSSDGILRMWELAKNKSVQIAVKKKGYTAISIHPSDQMIVTGNSEGMISIWDISSKEEIKTLKAHDESIVDIKFSKKGDLLLTNSQDEAVKIWTFEKLLEEKEEKFFVKLKSAVVKGELKNLVKDIWQKATIPSSTKRIKSDSEKITEIKNELPNLLSNVINGEKVYVKDIQERFQAEKILVDKVIIELLKEKKIIGKFNPFKGELIVDRGQPSELIDSTAISLEEAISTITCYSCGYPLTEGILECPNCKKEIEKCPVCKLQITFQDKIGICTNCGVKGHLPHMQEAFKVFGECPVCQKELNWEKDIITYTKEAKKEEKEEL